MSKRVIACAMIVAGYAACEKNHVLLERRSPDGILFAELVFWRGDALTAPTVGVLVSPSNGPKRSRRDVFPPTVAFMRARGLGSNYDLKWRANRTLVLSVARCHDFGTNASEVCVTCEERSAGSGHP